MTCFIIRINDKLLKRFKTEVGIGIISGMHHRSA